jgi:hypothetical protein
MKIALNLKLFFLCPLLLMQGCVTTDILAEGRLDKTTEEIVIQIQNRAFTTCVTTSYDSSDRQITGNTKAGTKPLIRRLFTSETDWYKAVASVNGVIDNIYYSSSSRRLICGQKLWDSFEDTKHIQFMEYGVSTKRVGVRKQTNPLPSSNQPQVMETRPIAVSWDGYSDLISGELTFLKSAPGTGSVKITLPKGDGTCLGQSKAIQPNTGVWTVSCTNGMSAAGTYESYGDGKGESGRGTDANGREVRYTIGGRN